VVRFANHRHPTNTSPIVKAAANFVNWAAQTSPKRKRGESGNFFALARVSAQCSTMRVIPVIDLMNGQVVRGVAGRRSEYRPIESRIAADAQAATVARAFVEWFGFDAVYVADLDSIVDGQPDVQAWEVIRGAGLKLWLDAGMGSKQLSSALRRRGSSLPMDETVILGSESLRDTSIVIDSLPFVGPSRIVFSLDLHDGKPLTSVETWKSAHPLHIVRWVIGAGIQKLLILDLADVGVGGGTTTLDLCREIRREFPSIELVAGGGVRGIEDLKALASAGCDAALVASALHDGRLTPEDVRQVENLPHGGQHDR
jgi:phosphoribosylformimino-5-aminoimidazole carboxamide ribotide isomerase